MLIKAFTPLPKHYRIKNLTNITDILLLLNLQTTFLALKRRSTCRPIRAWNVSNLRFPLVREWHLQMVLEELGHIWPIRSQFLPPTVISVIINIERVGDGCGQARRRGQLLSSQCEPGLSPRRSDTSSADRTLSVNSRHIQVLCEFPQPNIVCTEVMR